MPQAILPLDAGYYQGPNLPWAASECKGLIPIASQNPSTQSSGMLRTQPGEDVFATLPSGYTAFGRHCMGGLLYVIGKTGSAGALFSVTSAGVVTNLGAIASITGSERAICADNGTTLAIVIPGVGYYFYDATNGVQDITAIDADFAAFAAETGGIRSVVHIDGYFVFNTATKMIQSSLVNTNSGQDFDALDYLEPFLNQSLVRVGVVNGELYACGEHHIKRFRNVGNTTGFAFQEIPSATIQKGLSFLGAWVDFDNSFFFWGRGDRETDAIWRGVGGGAVTKISTDAIDAKLAEASYPSAFAHAYSWDGQLMVGFTQTDTYWYNVTASAIKGYPVWFVEDDVQTVQRVSAYQKVLVLSSSDSIRALNDSHNKAFGGASRECVFTSPYFDLEGFPVLVTEVELMGETGVASTAWEDSTDDTNPFVTLEYSKDAGRTWTTKGTARSGKNAEYKTNVRWNRLGRFDDRPIFRFTTDTVNRQAWTGIKIQYEGGYE